MDVLLLSEADVQRVLEAEALLDALAAEFVALTRGESTSPARNEVVVPDAQAEQVVEAIAAAAATGRIGDGKIFVSTIESALRIRTGEKDEAAI